MKVELRGLELFGYHGVIAEERSAGSGSSTTSSSRSASAAPTTGSRTRSTTAGGGGGARGRGRGRFDLLEALATAIADVLEERFRPERREGARAQAGRAPGRDRRRVRARHGRDGRDASPTSGSGRTSATARRRSGGRRS